MGMQSLADAKAALEAEEGQQEEVKGEQPKAKEPEAIEAEPADEPEAEGEQEPEAGASDDWMKSGEEEEEKEPEAKFTDHDAAAIRKKWKGRAKEAEDEVAKLRAEIEELKTKKPEVVAQPSKERPKRDGFESDEDFQEAMAVWVVDNRKAQEQSQNTAEQMQAARKQTLDKINNDVESHYERAILLAQKSNISAEAYQSADKAVRLAFEGVRPKEGDALVDGLIHVVGTGSEKVFYNLGVNKARREKAVGLLAEDPTGLKLIAYLGELKAQLNAPAARESKAPEPPERIQGDKSNNGNSRFRKAYEKAEAANDAQAMWSAKSAARKAGINTSAW